MGIPPIGGGVQLPPPPPNVEPKTAEEAAASPEATEAQTAAGATEASAPAAPTEAPGPAGATGGGDKTYTVASGDTLSEIWQKQAKPLGISYAEFQTNNAHLFDDKHKRANIKTQSQAGDYIKPGETVIIAKAKVAQAAAPAQGADTKSQFADPAKKPQGLSDLGTQSSASSAAWMDTLKQMQEETKVRPAPGAPEPMGNPYWVAWDNEARTPQLLMGPGAASYAVTFLDELEAKMLAVAGPAGQGMEMLQFLQTNKNMVLNGLPPRYRALVDSTMGGWMSNHGALVADSNKNEDGQHAAYALGLGSGGTMPGVNPTVPAATVQRGHPIKG